MKRRSPEYLLGVLGVLLVICLAFATYGHIRYMTAEKVYVDHLQHVIFSPHIDIKASLATYAEQADRWLRVRTAASVLAAGIIVGIVWQVIRRRNERISQTAVSTEA